MKHSPLARKTPLASGTSKLKRKPFKWKPRSRTTKTRTILYDKKYSALRLERAILANEHCEHCGVFAPFRSEDNQSFWTGQLAHLDRGAKRNSVIDRVRWLCRSCHDKFDNRNQKVVPAKR